jgi:H2-forming N5,N10-methylenetetrahydromethanopterin dehydrogenase-like enzyme
VVSNLSRRRQTDRVIGFTRENDLHIENKTSHKDIFCETWQVRLESNEAKEEEINIVMVLTPHRPESRVVELHGSSAYEVFRERAAHASA